VGDGIPGIVIAITARKNDNANFHGLFLIVSVGRM